MPWYLWSDYIMKRACRYLLSHYIGHFLEEKLTLDQLSIDLYNGTGVIKELSLDVASLNEALDHYNVPVEIVEGYIGSITVTIPWARLNSDSTLVQIESLELTLQPKQREENGDIGLEEMFSSMASMTSSLKLATEVLKEQHKEEHPRAGHDPQKEEVEKFAQTIDTVLSHVKVTFLNTTVRLEHLPRDADVGVGLELRVASIEYFDDIADNDLARGTWQPAFANKNIFASGVLLFVDEFHRSSRMFSRAMSFDSMNQDEENGADPVIELCSDGPVRSESVPFLQSDPIQVATFSGRQQLKIRIKQHDSVQGPKLELECQLGMISCLLTPRQVHVIMEILYGLATPWTCDDTNVKQKSQKRKQQNTPFYNRSNSGNSSEACRLRGPLPSLGTRDDSDLYYSALPGSSGLSDITATSIGLSQYTLDTNRSALTPSVKHGSSVEHNSRSHFNDGRSKSHTQAIHNKVVDEPSGDLTHYKLKVVFLSLVVLHENFSSSPGDGLSPGETATDKLKKLSKSFFETASTLLFNSVGGDLKSARRFYADACPLDHLGCLCKPLTLDCTQKMSQSGRSLSVDLSIGDFELTESLYDRSYMTTPSLGFSMTPKIRHPEYSEILVFRSEDSPVMSEDPESLYSMITPCVKVKVDNVNLHKQKRRRAVPPRMDFTLELGTFESEVDITIIDRVHTLFHPDMISHQESSSSQYLYSLTPTTYQTTQGYFTSALDEQSASISKIDLHLTSNACRVNFKFPVPVLGENYDHSAWWRRSLRKETVILDLSEFIFHTSLGDNDNPLELEFMCQEAHG